MCNAARCLLPLSLLALSLGVPPAAAQPSVATGHVDAGGGVRLAYRVVGTRGETIVLVHGGPGFTSDYLADDMGRLARRHRVFAYDQRGIGRSTLVTDSTALAAQRYVEDLEAIRRHLGVEQLTLLGHSWGAAPAAMYAMQHPQRVRRMILVGTIPFRRSELTTAFQRMAAGRDSATLHRMAELSRARRADPADLRACDEYYRLWFTPFFANGRAPKAMKGNVCAGSRESLRNKPNVDRYTFASLGDWDWSAELRKVIAPTLIIQGTLDPLPLESARSWAAAIPDARLLELPGIGHFPYAESPTAFFPAVERFLQGRWPKGAVR